MSVLESVRVREEFSYLAEKRPDRPDGIVGVHCMASTSTLRVYLLNGVVPGVLSLSWGDLHVWVLHLKLKHELGGESVVISQELQVIGLSGHLW